jgi:hypothetical protein
MTRTSFIALALITACGDDGGGGDGGGRDSAVADGGSPGEVPLLPGFRSGSRLRAHRLRVAGTPDILYALHDTELDVACFFATAEDGELRCLPQNRRFVDPTPVFTDAACTMEVLAYRGEASCEPEPFFLESVPAPDSCDGALAVTRLSEIPVPAALYSMEAACTGPNPVDGVVTAFRETGPWPASSFLRGRIVDQPIEGRLVARVIAGDDGSAFVRGLADTEHGDCSIGRTAGGSMGCIPDAGAFTGPVHDYFADAGCTEPLAGRREAPGCSYPPFIHVFEESGGTYRLRAHHRGDRVTGTVYAREGCAATDAASLPTSLYRIGAEVTDIVPLDEGLAGEGALRLQVATTTGGEPVLSYGRFSLPAGVSCTVAEIEPGALHCLPEPLFGLGDQYTDAACTAPVLPFDPMFFDELPRTATGALGQRCAAVSVPTYDGAFAVGAEHAGAVFVMGPGGCGEIPRQAGIEYHALTPLGPADLVEVTELLE